MLTAYIPGVWDLLHVGHLNVLQRAYQLTRDGQLIVGVPSDDVVKEDKGSLPIIPQLQRIEMLNAIWCVDSARPYDTLDFLPHLDRFRPDILAVGGTWGKKERHIQAQAWCKRNNAKFIKLPYTHDVSTTQIKQTILRSKDR